MYSSLFVNAPLLPSRRSLAKRALHPSPVCTSEPIPAAKRKRIRLLPPPSETAPLMRKPEAVVTATAAGLFLLAASAFRSVRMAFASVAARTSLLSEARRRTLRLEKRDKERIFLESAVQATEATLENTKTFLTAQKRRAEAAEVRLEQIGVSRQRLDDAASQIRAKKKELAHNERQLEEERGRAGSDGEKLLKMEMELERSRAGVEALEEVTRKERKRLEDEENEQREKLDKAKTETAKLEALLLDKEKQLQREREERDRYIKKHVAAERALEVASESLEQTVADLEDRRKRIEDMETEAKRTRIEAKRKKEGIMAVVKGEVDVAEIEKSMATVQKQQGICEEAMKWRNNTYESKVSEISQMKNLIEKRDSELEELRIKLESIPNTKATRRTRQSNSQSNNRGSEGTDAKLEKRSPSRRNGKTSPANQAENHTSTAVSHPDCIDIDTESLQDLKSLGVPEIATDTSTSPAANDTDTMNTARRNSLQTFPEQKGDTTTISAPTHPVGHQDVVVAEKRKMQPKGRRGRPRKTTGPTVNKTDSDQPKRARGRPKKTMNDANAAAVDAPKRKRGRPRKNPISTVS